MTKRVSPFKRITAHANWAVPPHRDMFDLDFDPHPSLGYAFAPAWTDPVVVITTVLQLLAYSYFGYSLGIVSTGVCSGFLAGLLYFLPAAAAVQLAWALKAVYLLDKAAPRSGSAAGMAWRVLRTGVMTLPFSFAPAWVIGCLAWPFLRIPLTGGSNFYDQSLVIGQYVQNSLWYIGARQGRLNENLHEFSEMTITNRSRYWDVAAEQNLFNLVALGVVIGVMWIAYYAVLETATIPLPWGRSVTGFGGLMFFGAILYGFLLALVNTTGLAAISILDYLRSEDVAVSEPDLAVDTAGRWILYLPHALAGAAIYGGLLFLVWRPSSGAKCVPLF